MKIRLREQIYIRHFGDESVVCCFRSGGCTVLKNAMPVLKEMSGEWCDVGNIIKSMTAKFDCDVADVAEGIYAVVDELKSQQFIDVEPEDGACSVLERMQIDGTNSISSNSQSLTLQDETWTPLGDFYARHNLPCELHIDLTDGCNEKCVHCYLPKGGSHFIEKELVFKVLKEFRDAQGMTVYFSGGECMLHRDFAAILRFAKSLNLNIVVMSNLTLCDENMVLLLKEINPQFVNVSLYAVTESIHDSITQVPGSCFKTKSAIDALLKAGVHVRLAAPFMQENKGCVEELKVYAIERNVHFVADSEIFGQLDHSCKNQSHALSISELEGLVSTHKEVFTKTCIEAAHCTSESKVCDIGVSHINLDAEGMYYPCDGFHGAILGNAHDETLLEVWNGNRLNRLRELRNKDFGECAFCEDRGWCKVCPMRNFNETGDMFTHAPWRCEATRLYRRIFEGE